MRCPKCAQSLPPYLDDEDPALLARTHAYEDCPYIACDDVTCRALKEPATLDEWQAAAVHWRSHRLYGGCSHGG